MPSPTRRSDLLRRAERDGDPRDALRALAELRDVLDELEHEQVTALRAAGGSWAQVAELLGITRQAAQKRHREPQGEPAAPAPFRGVLLTAAARAAVQAAREEAMAMGSPIVGSEHVLLGVVRSEDSRAALVLRDLGVTLDQARVAAQPTLVQGGPPEIAALGPGDDRLSRYARGVIDRSLLAAAARREEHISVEDLLIGLLDDETGGAARTLWQLGVTPDDVRERLEAHAGGPTP